MGAVHGTLFGGADHVTVTHHHWHHWHKAINTVFKEMQEKIMPEYMDHKHTDV